MKILSICLPTYNRSEKVIKQLKFLLSEIKGLKIKNDIEIIISDNCSLESHQVALDEAVKNVKNNGFDITYNKNISNVGLIGNLKILSELSTGEYIWFVGDDDKLYPGILSSLENSISNNKGMIFINHEGTDEKGEVILQQAFKHDEHNDLFDVFRHSKTSMMFITACVYKREIVAPLFKNENERLTIPLFLSFKCEEVSGVSFVKDVLIENKRGDISWREDARVVFYYNVPMELIKIVGFSKKKHKALFILFQYIFSIFSRAFYKLFNALINKFR
ncbi:glycosyltransferase [Enterovibrio norvegicus]|uniref:Glycosyltransferase n=1 Tax=Enterovibrio norvegicus TaxID=188144 RepID=A0ABV4KWA9_9GAMM|nr:glycosyltransferase family 2 protein [Enterovibrio norvegicus]OEF58810.1 hypothetical protein A1OU_11685 [Enterovibrio norvegicus]